MFNGPRPRVGNQNFKVALLDGAADQRVQGSGPSAMSTYGTQWASSWLHFAGLSSICLSI